MSHFLYFAHDLLQDCVSKRVAFAFLTFWSKRIKKKSVLFYKDFTSSFQHHHFPYSGHPILLGSLGVLILRHHFT